MNASGRGYLRKGINMVKYFIKVEKNKVIETMIGDDIDGEKEGFIEISEDPSVFFDTPLLYIDGKLQVDVDELERRNKDNELRIEYDTLMNNLSSTDYVVIKIAEGVAKKEDYADVLRNREEWRKRINELQEEIAWME